MSTRNEEEIIIVFDVKTNEVRIESLGFEGNTCSVAVNTIAKLVGEVTSRTMKADSRVKKQQVRRTQRN